MSWKLIDRPKTQKVTKKLATQFAEMEACPGDRPLSERRLQVYQKLVKEGKFRPVTWAMAICKETGEIYRVNGKHTSVMLSGMEEATLAELAFFVIMEEYECDTLEDVAKLYSTFDSAMQTRSAYDIYFSFASTVPELSSVGRAVIRVCPTGITYGKFGQDIYSKTNPAERAEMLLEHTDFVLWLKNLVDATERVKGIGGAQQKAQHLLRMPVVAAIFRTYEKSRSAALEFWSLVRDESGAAPSTPDRKLAKYLTLAGLKTDAKTAKQATSQREVYVKCLRAWNAWRKNEPTNLNYSPEAKIPSVL